MDSEHSALCWVEPHNHHRHPSLRDGRQGLSLLQSVSCIAFGLVCLSAGCWSQLPWIWTIQPTNLWEGVFCWGMWSHLLLSGCGWLMPGCFWSFFLVISVSLPNKEREREREREKEKLQYLHWVRCSAEFFHTVLLQHYDDVVVVAWWISLYCHRWTCGHWSHQSSFCRWHTPSHFLCCVWDSQEQTQCYCHLVNENGEFWILCWNSLNHAAVPVCFSTEETAILSFVCLLNPGCGVELLEWFISHPFQQRKKGAC